MKNTHLPLFFCVSLCVGSNATRAMHNQSNNVYATNAIYPNVSQLLTIVRTELKKPEYAQDVLPNDFSYFNDLMRYGQEMRHRQDYARSVCGIFSKVLGGSQYVNAYAFAQLLEVLPGTLKPYFVSYKSFDLSESITGLDADMYHRFKEAVSHTLYVQFSSQYDMFKASPIQFFDELSLYIADIAQQEMDTQQLRTSIKRFLEIALNKLVWNHEEHTKIWSNIKNIASSLSLLMEARVIEDPADLDDMYWTLIHRFNYFLDLFGSELPVNFFQEIKNDIMDGNLFLLSLEEQDVCIQTKQECLAYAILKAEATSRAYERGILVR